MQLRKFTITDAERVATLVNDEAISRWTSKIPCPCTTQHIIDWIEGLKTKLNRNPYAVIVDDEIVACVSWWPEGDGDVEVGYWVGKDYWGKGLASRALAMLLELPEIPKNKRLVAKVLEGNTASERVLLKNGFVFTGECELSRMGNTVAGKAFVRKSKKTQRNNEHI